MKDIAIYIHEKTEAQQKRPATDGFLQIATCLNLIMEFDYEARTPWEAKEEFAPYFESILKSRKSATIVANGIGAFFCHARLARHRDKKGVFYLPYRKYGKFDPKHAVAGKRERGGAVR